MDILVHVIRHVIVNDVSHPWDIQTPCSHGCSYEDRHGSYTKVVQSFFPLPLETITVDAGGGQALSGQVGGQEVSIPLGLRIKNLGRH